ncbi:MAG TPA: hypothetical protein VEX86_17295 [Longimicrobium sp.]|nr:hypothetical protein [Longimicrobium sp.]
MQIRIAELREVSEVLFRHLEQNGVDQVDLAQDYYWNVPAGERYDPYQQPAGLDLGQLTDDWRELQRLRSGEREPVAYGLVWLSAILRAVGEQVPR